MVLRLDAAEAARLQRLEDEAESISRPRNIDRGDAPNCPVRVVGYANRTGTNGKQYTVYTFTEDGVEQCEKRFSDLNAFHANLKRRFRWYTFPMFPVKQMNGLFGAALGEAQLRARQRELDTYFRTVSAVEDIYKSPRS